MALKSGRVGVNPDQVDLHGRLKNITPPDLSAYVKKSEAVGYDDILTETDAATTYLSISSASTDFQPKLESGVNIKTINNESLLGSGNIVIQGGGGDLSAYVQKSEAPGYDDILTETEASSVYQTQSGMSSYVQKTQAPGYTDILTQTDANATYLKKSDASSTYVQKSQAPGYDDILTETEAASLYQVKSDYAVYGNETGSLTTNINADELNGYSMLDIVKFILPVGSVVQNTNNINPSTYITGTTWVLKSSVALASENVFGNGKTLALTDGTNLGAYNTDRNVYQGLYGQNAGTSNTTSSFASGKGVGVPTKVQTGSTPENSGLVADIITIYTWERTV